MMQQWVQRWNLADPEEVLGFLLWFDCLDRSGILLLEIRHFQANLIHALGMTALYRPLRFEERYLWGECVDDEWGKTRQWLEVFEVPGLKTAHLDSLANRWIIRYPLHDKLREESGRVDDDDKLLEPFFAREKRKAICKCLRQELAKTWGEGLWSQDALRRYNTLCAAQIIKTHVLRDILIFCRWGSRAFGHLEPPRNRHELRDRRAHMLLVRSAVLRRLREQVERFGDLQAQFERTLDLQLQENPRPIVERRREQGMYTSFLADRCADAYTDIDELITKFGSSPVETSRAARFERVDLTPLTMHRWQHSYTSSCKLVLDEGDWLAPGRREKGGTNIHFINTSYWMPDRPDLQVVIAHEISHNIIKESYGEFDAESLPLYRDAFAKLIRLLSHCMEEAGLTRDNDAAPVRSYPDLTLREIGSDLLSASIYDHAYLFALCEEIIGVGLDSLFLDPHGNCDLRMGEHIRTTIAAYEEEREWYYRLRIICAWLKAIDPPKVTSPLAGFLVDGVEKTLECMLGYLASIMPEGGAENRDYWETLTDRMCEIVSRSEAADVVRKWRGDNRQQNDKMDGGENELRRISRHMRRLPVPVRRFLYQDVIRKKTGENRALRFWSDDEYGEKDAAALVKIFEEFYFGARHTLDIMRDRPPIYRHLRDIPWETHILRAIDFVHGAHGRYNRIPSHQWINVAAQQAAPGRAIYKVAMEFHCWLGRNPVDRLSAAVRLLKSIDIKKVATPAERQKLCDWVGPNRSEHETREAVAELFKNIKEYLARGMTYRKTDLDRILNIQVDRGAAGCFSRFGAEVLLLAHPANLERYAPVKTTRQQMYVLEHLQGEKLERLGDIIDGAEAQLKDTLSPLREYLEVRHKRHNSETELMLEKILRAFSAVPYGTGTRCREAARSWKEGLPDLETYSLGRIAVTGLRDPSRKGSLNLTEVFAQGAWEAGTLSDRREFHPVLGANDIMSLAKARPTQRWSLPVFKGGESSDPCSEEFMRFFERRERAIPVRHALDQHLQWPRGAWRQGACPEHEDPHFAGFLSVFLSQRALRMDFVWRLLQGKEGSLHQLAGQLKQGDYIFLGQGIGDVIFAFGRRDGEDPLAEIFEIQNILYEDFMVDRTELILSPMCLRFAAMNPQLYQVIVQFRTRESRQIAKCNEELTKEIMRKNRNDFTLCRTPGRADFAIVFTDLSRFVREERPICTLYEIFENQLDRIEDVVTTLGCRYP